MCRMIRVGYPVDARRTNRPIPNQIRHSIPIRTTLVADRRARWADAIRTDCLNQHYCCRTDLMTPRPAIGLNCSIRCLHHCLIRSTQMGAAKKVDRPAANRDHRAEYPIAGGSVVQADRRAGCCDRPLSQADGSEADLRAHPGDLPVACPVNCRTGTVDARPTENWRMAQTAGVVDRRGGGAAWVDATRTIRLVVPGHRAHWAAWAED